MHFPGCIPWENAAHSQYESYYGCGVKKTMHTSVPWHFACIPGPLPVYRLPSEDQRKTGHHFVLSVDFSSGTYADQTSPAGRLPSPIDSKYHNCSPTCGGLQAAYYWTKFRPWRGFIAPRSPKYGSISAPIISMIGRAQAGTFEARYATKAGAPSPVRRGGGVDD